MKIKEAGNLFCAEYTCDRCGSDGAAPHFMGVDLCSACTSMPVSVLKAWLMSGQKLIILTPTQEELDPTSGLAQADPITKQAANDATVAPIQPPSVLRERADSVADGILFAFAGIPPESVAFVVNAFVDAHPKIPSRVELSNAILRP